MPFTLHDNNMNKLNYPVGIRSLDFLVSSIQKNRLLEKIDGIPGTVDYGYTYEEREISLSFWLKHKHGEHDFKLLRSEINSMLDSYSYFYISDDYLPSRVLKISIDESYQPERIMHSRFSNLELKATIIGLPFWRTKYTSQELNDEGYTAIVDKYGTADNIHIDHTQYTYKTNEFTIYNSGNVTIDPRHMELSIMLRYVNSPGNFTIENVTTGEKFVYKSAINNNHLTLDGTKVNVGVYNRLRDSNRQFISLVKGVNKIKIYNGTFEEIKFDSPFYFK
ncbi:hypothetical protein RSA37_11905 [Mammaliicoccus sciuri]|uniref:phage tail domain-containing protein n=1 Tax=Mammaliicoccus sciuri TaxID=1296 RepID=UPI000734239A|nr:phage tail domain-containing protein [Mammaliicoccus sciuri]KTT82730.1 hypothetical protein NS1R_12165 [Mammaliicoccus sciuri]KTT88213.1 hypothetical protein NS112_09325 [Mammaliicoccus sciuri]KTT89756.1 hypothetical protein NS36R_07850 [Mammaliicoccus sciuri]KTT94148.1 hypothetical protein NS44R_08265 [Mammaliicoccus sciuri]KTW10746.1 hypothetical protein RSA37_11905 [Mammaliicoccus sciuri]